MVEIVSRHRGPLFRVISDQRVAFLLVGAFNTVFGTVLFVAFQLLYEALRVGRFDYMLSLLSAHAGSVICSFALQRNLVFRVKGRVWLDFIRFVGVSLTALGVNLLLLTVLVETFAIPKIPSQLIVTACIAVGTFFLHRDFSFSRKREPEGRVEPSSESAESCGGVGADKKTVNEHTRTES